MMHWCYTFMYPGYCESVDELKISQALLLVYFHSPSVCKFLSHELHWIIHNILVSYVFIHEKSFCFCYQKSICQYNESMNSSHESINLRMKEHMAPIYGSQNIHTSPVMHKLQSDIVINEHMQNISS